MEKYKFLGPNKEYLKNKDKTAIAFILRYKKIYLGRGIKGFDNIIQKNPKLKEQAESSGKDAVLKYCGFIWPDNNVLIINNFPTKTIFHKYIHILDKQLSRKKKLGGKKFNSPLIRKNKDDWFYKAGKMKYLPLSKYKQVNYENMVIGAKEREDEDLTYEKTPKGDLVIVPNSKEIRAEVKEHIKDQIDKNDESMSYRTIFGKKYIVGVDDQNNVTVYDWDGTSYEMKEFYGIVKDRRKQENKLNNINKIDMYLEFIDKEPEKFVDDLREAHPDKLDHKLLTDRDDIPKKLSRSYPVIEYEGRELIVEGRFKGYYLDEMINMAGRQIGGTGYYLDERGIPRVMERKNSTLDERSIVTKHEPYVTYSEDTNKMVVVLPEGDDRTKKIMNDLVKKHRGIKSKSSQTFEFSPRLFEIIQREIMGFVLSEKANKVIQKQRKRDNEQIQRELTRNYDHISTSTIEGMKTKLDDGTPLEFMNHQKKAIDHLLRNEKGFIGLDTGTGKSMVAIGTMMQWIDDGTLKKDGKNGKVLFVGNASLRGNFPAEIKKVVQDYSEVKPYFDVVSYSEFKDDPETYKQYGCLVFDEAQAMRNHKSKVHKAAREVDHPRKILLTASVLEKSPVDLYNLVAIKNNKKFENKDEEAKDRADFVNSFCEKVGNKVIGLKDDPGTQRMFRKWIRQEAIYIDKQDVKEVDLPEITPPKDRTVSLEMTDEMKEKYRELAEPVKDTLSRMKEKYKKGQLSREEIDQELTKVMGNLQKINTFLALPESYLGEDHPNPKVNHVKDFLVNSLETNNSFKMVSFTDKPALAKKAGSELSKAVSAKRHVVGLAEGIQVYKNGEIVESITRSNMKDYTDEDGNPLTLGNYQVELLNQYQKQQDIASFNLTSAYTKGHNLQRCDSVINLDRDTWNNEKMKQRVARVHRTGNTKPVEVQTLDNVIDSGDSLDEIQKYSMEIERSLFDELVDKSFDKEYIEHDQEVVNVADIQQLLKNKEAYYYQLNPNVKFSSKIKNE